VGDMTGLQHREPQCQLILESLDRQQPLGAMRDEDQSEHDPQNRLTYRDTRRLHYVFRNLDPSHGRTSISHLVLLMDSKRASRRSKFAPLVRKLKVRTSVLLRDYGSTSAHLHPARRRVSQSPTLDEADVFAMSSAAQPEAGAGSSSEGAVLDYRFTVRGF
jgi:hypothetical protein